MVTPILSSQVAKHGSESKAAPRMREEPMLESLRCLGADRATPGMWHSCPAGTHLNKTVRDPSPWLLQAAQKHPEPRECLRAVIFSRVALMSCCSHGPVSVTLAALSTQSVPDWEPRAARSRDHVSWSLCAFCHSGRY